MIHSKCISLSHLPTPSLPRLDTSRYLIHPARIPTLLVSSPSFVALEIPFRVLSAMDHLLIRFRALFIPFLFPFPVRCELLLAFEVVCVSGFGCLRTCKLEM